jgi:hypothetical protein
MSLRAATALSLLALASACHRPAPGDASEGRGDAPASSTPAASVAPPTDHLAPGELIEGSEQAFGVVLPRDLRVKGRFVDAVYTTGRPSVHALTQYFRARLEDGSLREGVQAATFEHVRVRGKPGLELFVHVAAARDGTNVEIRNATPQPASPLMDEPARWKEVGLTPHGRIADPTHLD